MKLEQNQNLTLHEISDEFQRILNLKRNTKKKNAAELSNFGKGIRLRTFQHCPLVDIITNLFNIFSIVINSIKQNVQSFCLLCNL